MVTTRANRSDLPPLEVRLGINTPESVAGIPIDNLNLGKTHAFTLKDTKKQDAGTLPPGRRELPKRVLERIRSDIADAKRVVEYAGDRVFHDKKPPSTDKVLRLSDRSATYIKKGGRNPVIGSKAQVVGSEKGFFTNLISPEGNAADSIKLEPGIAIRLNAPVLSPIRSARMRDMLRRRDARNTWK